MLALSLRERTAAAAPHAAKLSARDASAFLSRSQRATQRQQKGSSLAATPTLNERALRLADHMASQASALRIAVQQTPSGGRVLDCGIKTPGGLQAGLQ